MGQAGSAGGEAALASAAAKPYPGAMHGGKLLYPVLGTGCFFALFWLGYVAAQQIGLHPFTGLVVGLVTGGAGVMLVAQLERLDPDS